MKDEVKPTAERPPVDLKTRTREFSLRVIRLYTSLPNSTVAQILGKQLLRSATSVGAHYREGHRSRSDAEFISKLEGALQESEESAYWLELLEGAEVFSAERLRPLRDEVEQLIAIFTTCVKNTKSKKES
jgi:four helix bundle protein